MEWIILWILLIPVALLFTAKPLVAQAKLFLHQHNAPPLNLMQRAGVSLIFVLAGTSLLLTQMCSFLDLKGVPPNLNITGTAKCLLVLAWGIPMVLLDLRKCWLPLCFTNGFWISGLLFTFLPGSSQNLWQALAGSGGMFAFLYVLHAGAKRLYGEEGFGRGDVHLIAGLCAWFPWPLASLISGCGFLLFIVGALVTQKYAQPYAPWLFALLAAAAGFFPELTITGAL